MPTVVRLNDGKSEEKLSNIDNPVPTQRGLPMPKACGTEMQGSIVSVSNIRAITTGPLIPKIEKPCQELDKGRIKCYRVHPRGKSMFYAIKVDEQEIGPFILIQEIKADRGRYFLKLSPDTVRIPDGLRHLVYFKRMSLVYDQQMSDHWVFVSPEEEIEEIREIMRSKYPNPRAPQLPQVTKSQAYNYLVICAREVG